MAVFKTFDEAIICLRRKFLFPEYREMTARLELVNMQMAIVSETESICKRLKKPGFKPGRMNNVWEPTISKDAYGSKSMNCKVSDSFSEYCENTVEWLQGLGSVGLPVDDVTSFRWVSEGITTPPLYVNSIGVDSFSEEITYALAEPENSSFWKILLLAVALEYLDRFYSLSLEDVFMTWTECSEKLNWVLEPPWWWFVDPRYYEIDQKKVVKKLKTGLGLVEIYKVISKTSGNSLIDVDTSDGPEEMRYSKENVIDLLRLAKDADKTLTPFHEACAQAEKQPEALRTYFEAYEAGISPREKGHTIKWLKRKGLNRLKNARNFCSEREEPYEE